MLSKFENKRKRSKRNQYTVKNMWQGDRKGDRKKRTTITTATVITTI